MKIIRDGEEYELNNQELFEAHEEYEHMCNAEDLAVWLDNWCEDCGFPRESVTKEDEDNILENFEDKVERYDVFGAAFDDRRCLLMNDAIREILEH